MEKDDVMVTVVVFVSECDVIPVPGLRPSMPYDMGVETLRQLYRAMESDRAIDSDAPEREYDLCYTEADGELGRFASWAL